MTRVSRFMALLAVLMLGLVPAAAWAQSFRGTILGTVRDATGAVLPGVTITVTNVATNISRTSVTESGGNYVVPELGVGTYTVTAELQGFKKEIVAGLQLQVDQRLRADVRMTVGQISETIEVTGETPLVATDSSTVGTVIDNLKVVELPLNGRQFLQLNLLVPGAAPGVFGSQLSTQGGSISVNGMREAGNNFLLDGIDNNDLAINLFSISPSVDAIEEFKVQSATYSAEYGKQAGAQINVTTKSGTNELHGTVFEFFRDDALDARNFFDDPSQRKPPFRRNQFGGSAGGPLIRNQTFWFANYDGTRISKAITNAARIPSLGERTGDFSQSPGVTIRDPLTGQAFPGNQIPPDRINEVGRAVAALYPTPNLGDPRRNFVSSPAMRRDIDQFTVRIDHKLGDSDHVFGRYTLNDDPRFDTFEPFTKRINGTEVPGFGAFTENRQQLAGIGWTRILSSKLFNELRVGYNRFRGAIFQENIRNDVTSRLGIRNTSTVPLDFGTPHFLISGFSNLGEATNLPQNRRDNTYEVKNSLSYTTGSHALKGGVEFREFQNYILFDTVARGQFNFTGAFTGNSVADLLLGVPFQATLNVPDGGLNASNVIYQRFFGFGGFFQDDWKVGSNLTLNLGVRYGVNEPIKEKRNRLSKFSLEQSKLAIAGRDGQGDALYDWDTNNFAPRVGFAWTPFDTTRTVIRGGYGMFYDTKLTNNFTGMSLNIPFRTLYLFANDPSRAPGFSLSNLFPADPASSALVPLPSPNGVLQNYPDGYSQQWSLNAQRELWADLVVEIGYVGSKGTNLDRTYNPNQPRPGPGAVQPRRPFPQFGNMSYRIAEASSIYHSAQFRVEKRYSHGLTFLGSYTFGKAIDNASLWNAGAQDSNNLDGERGLADFDVRHRFSYSFSWELPFGRERAHLANLSPVAEAILGGWQLSGIVFLQTGQPLTPIIPTDRANIGSTGQRPDLIGDPNLPRSERDPSRWFNSAAFRDPAPFTFGNAGRNIIEGPGVNNVDLSVMKNFRFGSERRLQFRAEFFNVFNRPNFDPPTGGNLNVLSPSAGVITSAKDSRQIQLGLKLYF